MPGVSWRWETSDRHRPWTLLAAAAVTAGVALAVLGLPPVDWHGPLHRFGIMDPLCGATRGVRLTLRGDLAGAVLYNPAAPGLVAAAALVLLRAAFGAMTGRWLTVQLARSRTAAMTAAVLVAALWINQQAHAPLLLAR